MESIRKALRSETNEILDLWLKTTSYSNSFVEPDFWETHYDYIKENYINERDTFVYVQDGKITGFACVSTDNMISGLFVAPECQNKGIGTKLISFLQSEYSILHIEVYAQNRKALAFSERLGFLIDGAKRHEFNNEVMYTMMWSE